MHEAALLVTVAKSVTLVFGGLVTFVAYRASRRTGSHAMWALMVGLGMVTAGALLAGAVHQLLAADLIVAVAVQSCFTAVGFAVMAYSLYTRAGVPVRPGVEDARDSRGPQV